MADLLQKSYQETLDSYGEPKGKLAQAQVTETETETTSTPKEKPISEQIGEFLTKDYGKLKSVEANGKMVQLPEVTDEQFDSDFAKAFRMLRSQEGA